MSESITPSGTTRTAFSVSTNDLEINGDVTASKFIGSGERITNLNVDSINRGNALNTKYGGTNNNTYINQGIVFNNNSSIINDNKFETSQNIRWDDESNILYINNKNIVQDSSNYVKTTSNILLNKIESKIENSSNVITTDILTHIQDTLGIDNTTGIPVASATSPGIVTVGDGLFMSSEGLLSINPENIQNIPPSVIPSIQLQELQQSLVKSIYKKYIFKYNPNLGTTFDYDKSIEGIGSILPIWYNFSEIVNTSQINNKGNTTTSSSDISSDKLIIYGSAVLKPDDPNELKYEYTPLNNNYLYLDGVDGTYAEISDKCDIQEIYSTGGLGGDEVGITFAFWFKCSDPENSKSFMYLSSDDSLHYINIGIDDSNNLTFNIFNSGKNDHTVTRYGNLFDGKWVHLCWTINGDGKWFIYINGVKENNITTTRNIEPGTIYINKYIGRSRYSTNNTLKCSISDFRIYNKELNDTYINELFNATNYTEYVLTYHEQDNGIFTDIIMIGGGGGGCLEGGGGAGKLIYINNANIFSGKYRIKIGRGGAGNHNTQTNTSGNDTQFDTLVANGGGSHGDNSGIGGSGSGNGGTITDNSSTPIFNTEDIYLKGNKGYTIFGGGGGAGTEGFDKNGGDGVYEINNAGLIVNFKDNFDLPTDNSIGYYNSTYNKLYFAGGGSSNINGGKGGLGGGGDGSTTFNESLTYHGRNGSGGGGYDDTGASGGDGIIILRFIDLLIQSIEIPESVLDTSNYVSLTSNLLSENLNTSISDTSNYVSQTSNLISSNLNLAIDNTSNYVSLTSNLILANLISAINDLNVRLLVLEESINGGS